MTVRASILTILTIISLGVVHGNHLIAQNSQTGTITRIAIGDFVSRPALSADGRFVAFESDAKSLVPGDTNDLSDVFVRDLQMGTTTRVSVSSSGAQATGQSRWPAISADGRYVAFYSTGANLASHDTLVVGGIFVHDRQMRLTTLVSLSTAGEPGNGGFAEPVISVDGRFVAFSSESTNLVDSDRNNTWDIFVHDRQTGTTTRISVALDGTESNGFSYFPAISAEGRYIAFASDATNLVPDDSNNVRDIFIHDQQTSDTKRASVSSDGKQVNDVAGLNFPPSLSGDGRYLVYHSSTNKPSPETNHDGIFVHNLQTGTTTRISVSPSGEQSNGGAASPAISADGRFVAFSSEANNLVSDDANGDWDIFVYDQQTGITTLITKALNGSSKTGGSAYWPVLSADGRYVSFGSNAPNLVPDDTSNSADLFVYDREGMPNKVYSTSGRVTGSNPTCTAGVTISANAGYGTITNESGAYILGGLPAGTYTLTPSKDGCTFSPPTSQSIRVPPDSSGQDFVGLSASLPPSGKPALVLVHGYGGMPPWGRGSCDWPDPVELFKKMAGSDALNELEDKYQVEYAKLETSQCHTPRVADNVWRLGNAIQQAKYRSGQSKVIIVAHSMGGLVARAYIEGSDYDNDVSELFTFGTPHLGVYLDVLAFFANGLAIGQLCELHPGGCEQTTVGMTQFNKDYSQRRDGTDGYDRVIYHVITGNAPIGSRTPLGWLMAGVIFGPDDGFVHRDSGIGLSGTIDRMVSDEVHDERLGAQSYFIRDGGPSQSYDRCLKRVLLIEPSSIDCGNISIAQDGNELPALPMSRTPFEHGILFSGQSVTRTLSGEGGTTLFAAGWQTGTVKLILVDPTGRRIDSVYADDHSEMVAYTGGSSGASYLVTDTIPGTWAMILEAGSIPVEGSRYTTFATFESAMILTAGADQPWYRPGATAIITASLTPLAANTIVTATVVRSDGITDTIELSLVDSGHYRAAYLVPVSSGYTEVHVAATGISSEGVSFERGASILFQTMSSQFTLNDEYADVPYGSPTSLAYEGLTVTVGINASVTGTVGLSGDLVGPEGAYVAHSIIVGEVAPGTNGLPLKFDGKSIYTSSRNGPYTLTNLLLTDKRVAPVVAAEKDNVYTTAAYTYQQFGPARIIYLPTVMR